MLRSCYLTVVEGKSFDPGLAEGRLSQGVLCSPLLSRSLPTSASATTVAGAPTSPWAPSAKPMYTGPRALVHLLPCESIAIAATILGILLDGALPLAFAVTLVTGTPVPPVAKLAGYRVAALALVLRAALDLGEGAYRRQTNRRTLLVLPSAGAACGVTSTELRITASLKLSRLCKVFRRWRGAVAGAEIEHGGCFFDAGV